MFLVGLGALFLSILVVAYSTTESPVTFLWNSVSDFLFVGAFVASVTSPIIQFSRGKDVSLLHIQTSIITSIITFGIIVLLLDITVVNLVLNSLLTIVSATVFVVLRSRITEEVNGDII